MISAAGTASLPAVSTSFWVAVATASGALSDAAFHLSARFDSSCETAGRAAGRLVMVMKGSWLVPRRSKTVGAVLRGASRDVVGPLAPHYREHGAIGTVRHVGFVWSS